MSNRNKDQIKVTSTEDKTKIDQIQNFGYSTDETTDEIKEKLIINRKSGISESYKDTTTKNIHDNSEKKEKELRHETKKQKN